jgi:pilus assembly protein FimV
MPPAPPDQTSPNDILELSELVEDGESRSDGLDAASVDMTFEQELEELFSEDLAADDDQLAPPTEDELPDLHADATDENDDDAPMILHDMAEEDQDLLPGDLNGSHAGEDDMPMILDDMLDEDETDSDPADAPLVLDQDLAAAPEPEPEPDDEAEDEAEDELLLDELLEETEAGESNRAPQAQGKDQTPKPDEEEVDLLLDEVLEADDEPTPAPEPEPELNLDDLVDGGLELDADAEAESGKVAGNDKADGNEEDDEEILDLDELLLLEEEDPAHEDFQSAPSGQDAAQPADHKAMPQAETRDADAEDQEPVDLLLDDALAPEEHEESADRPTQAETPDHSPEAPLQQEETSAQHDSSMDDSGVDDSSVDDLDMADLDMADLDVDDLDMDNLGMDDLAEDDQEQAALDQDDQAGGDKSVDSPDARRPDAKADVTPQDATPQSAATKDTATENTESESAKSNAPEPGQTSAAPAHTPPQTDQPEPEARTESKTPEGRTEPAPEPDDLLDEDFNFAEQFPDDGEPEDLEGLLDGVDIDVSDLDGDLPPLEDDESLDGLDGLDELDELDKLEGFDDEDLDGIESLDDLEEPALRTPEGLDTDMAVVLPESASQPRPEPPSVNVNTLLSEIGAESASTVPEAPAPAAPSGPDPALLARFEALEERLAAIEEMIREEVAKTVPAEAARIIREEIRALAEDLGEE